jgi:hypothetical protein
MGLPIKTESLQTATRKASGACAHFLGIGGETGNKRRFLAKKRVFIGEFEDLTKAEGIEPSKGRPDFLSHR